MIAPGADLKVYVATRPVDFRKGHDGLGALVQQMFGLDPFSGAAFVFRAKRADRVKILVWDRTGLVLVHKRLALGNWTGRACFHLKPIAERMCAHLSTADRLTSSSGRWNWSGRSFSDLAPNFSRRMSTMMVSSRCRASSESASVACVRANCSFRRSFSLRRTAMSMSFSSTGLASAPCVVQRLSHCAAVISSIP